jgi:hypothetical protein
MTAAPGKELPSLESEDRSRDKEARRLQQGRQRWGRPAPQRLVPVALGDTGAAQQKASRPSSEHAQRRLHMLSKSAASAARSFREGVGRTSVFRVLRAPAE